MVSKVFFKYSYLRNYEDAYCPIFRFYMISLISPRMRGSSLVGGAKTLYSSASFLIVLQRILPDLVFGKRFTILAFLKQATVPILFLIISSNSS